MQSLFDVVPEEMNILIYADDIILLSVSPFSRLVRKRMQNAVNKIAEWAHTVGFTFAPDKSKLLHFGLRRKKIRSIPPLLMNNKTIPLVNSARILGVWIDNQLKFTNHANRVRKASTPKLNILKKICSACGAGSRLSLFRIVHGWLLPSMLHGYGLFSRGGEPIISKLAPIYNHAVRIISGAFRSSPISSLMAESGQQPFEYILAKNITTKAIRWLSYNRNPEAPMIARSQKCLARYHTTLPKISLGPEPRLHNWNAPLPKIDLTLLSKIRAGDNPSIVLPQFYDLVDRKYKNLPKLYTDGSKTTCGLVGCGIFSDSNSTSIALPSTCSVYSSEAFALLTAAQDFCPPSGSVLFSDSASVLKTMSAGNMKHPWIAKLSKLAVQKNITLCWIPGHVQIPGNEAADRLAASGGQLPPP